MRYAGAAREPLPQSPAFDSSNAGLDSTNFVGARPTDGKSEEFGCRDARMSDHPISFGAIVRETIKLIAEWVTSVRVVVHLGRVRCYGPRNDRGRHDCRGYASVDWSSRSLPRAIRQPPHNRLATTAITTGIVYDSFPNNASIASVMSRC
jgi:hypothetical protein